MTLRSTCILTMIFVFFPAAYADTLHVPDGIHTGTHGLTRRDPRPGICPSHYVNHTAAATGSGRAPSHRDVGYHRPPGTPYLLTNQRLFHPWNGDRRNGAYDSAHQKQFEDCVSTLSGSHKTRLFWGFDG